MFLIRHTPAREKLFREAGIHIEYFKENKKKYLVFDEARLEAVLRMTNSHEEYRYGTEYQHMTIIDLGRGYRGVTQGTPEAPTISVLDWQEHQYDSRDRRVPTSKPYEKILKEFLPQLGVATVVLRYRDRRNNVLPERAKVENEFEIIFWNSPSGTTHTESYDQRIFGKRIGGDGFYVYDASGLGEIITDTDGWPLAELEGNTLHVYHPLHNRHFAFGGGDGPTIFKFIMQEVAVHRLTSPKQRADLVRARALEKRAETRAQYTQMCASRLTRTLEATRAQITNLERAVEQTQQTLITQIRDLADNRGRLTQLESTNPQNTERYGSEFDKLFELPKILDVRIARDKISVFTDILYCVDPRTNRTHEIGKFRIDILPNSGVLWHNLTRKVNRMMAPHVDEAGRACLGTLAQTMPDLIARYEFATVAMLAISFIESVNVHDGWGQHIRDWPIVVTQPRTEAA